MNIKKTLAGTLIVTAMLALPSCATIFSHSAYPIAIKSTPEGATISITDKRGLLVYKGETPAYIKLRTSDGYFSKENYEVTFRMDGYQDRTVPITFRIDGWYFGNVLIGGVIGLLIVDPLTGAMWKIDRDFINETLSRKRAQVALNVVDINDIPAEWKTHLIKINK